MPRCRTIHGCISLLFALVFFMMPSAEAVTINQAQELPDLVGEASRAALVEVLDVRYGLDERDLHSTWITMRVLDPIYGSALPAEGGELTIKLYGAPAPLGNGATLFLEGTPRYEPGQKWVLLLAGTSSWGFTSTTGLHQGAFVVSGDAPESFRARSLAGNRRVIGRHGLGAYLGPSDVGEGLESLLAPTDAPVPYALLRAAILRLASSEPARRQGGRVEVLR